MLEEEGNGGGRWRMDGEDDGGGAGWKRREEVELNK